MSTETIAPATAAPRAADVPSDEAQPEPPGSGNALEVLAVATRLGLTSFGGPVAHLGYFREEYVHRRRWLDERHYADLVALCQFLPGPASSQVGIAIGITRAGLPGGLAAWVGFTLPSVLLLVAFAYGARLAGDADAGWLHGLKVVAVAVVAQAVWGMARQLCPDRSRATIAVAAALAVLAWPAAPRAGAGDRAGRSGRLALPAGRRPTRARPAARPGWPRPGGRLLARLLRSPRDPAPAAPGNDEPRCRAGGQFLPRWIAGLRRRTRRATAPAGGGRPARMADRTAVRRRLWRGPGGAGPALHVRGLPRRGVGSGAERLDRRGDRDAGSLPAFLPPGGRRAPVLGHPPPPRGLPVRAGRDQRGGGRPAAGRAVHARLDQRHSAAGRLRPRPGRVRPAPGLEDATLDRLILSALGGALLGTPG